MKKTNLFFRVIRCFVSVQAERIFPEAAQRSFSSLLKGCVICRGDYTVCPGHNKATTLDFERKNNRYMRAL